MEEKKISEETHGHGHDHAHGEEAEGGIPWLLIAAAGAFAVCLLLEHLFSLPLPVTILLYAVPWLLAGHETIAEALEGIVHGEVFGEEFLMTLASVGAFAVGSCEEGAAVMLLFGLGEYLEELAVGKTRSSVRALMAIRPDVAHVMNEAGGYEDEVPEHVAVSSLVEVRIGERIPVDGVVVSGSAGVDTSSLTGEPEPRTAVPGDTVYAGCVCTDGVLRIRVTKPASASAAARILALTEEASERKTRTETFLARFSRIYTPCVVGAAILLAVIPSLITGAWGTWIRRALTFLVVSCPCALVISVPLGFFCGIGAASSQGVLIKGSGALEALSRVTVIASDKTGTLTEGRLHVTEISGTEEDRMLYLAAHAEIFSGHPAARAIREAYREKTGTDPDETRVRSVREESGKGICAEVNENGGWVTVLAGNAALTEAHGIVSGGKQNDFAGTSVHLAANGVYLGVIRETDTLRGSAAETVRALRTCGVKEIRMLTGDTAEAAKPVSEALGLDGYRASLLPEDKLRAAEELKARHADGTLLYIGDGINDAPLLAMADVSAAMGGLGSDAAMEAADLVIMGDDLSRLPSAMRISKKTMRIAKQNIVFAIAVKVLIMVLGALGLTGMWAAVFGDVGVTLLCILNAAKRGK